MLLMLHCGLRVNEVNQLEANDIDFDNLTIMLAGAKNKNRKTRAVPMTKKVAEELRMLIGVLPHAHQLKNENKMNFRSNKLKTRNVLLVLKSTHQINSNEFHFKNYAAFFCFPNPLYS